ncbi:hypothetical protein HHK36_016588 [Tetracentron sinense]|uniref:C2H2-type domain-containing protein n=1 Tax=Tetracentron sinense TaxID=13715 RepID=A0A835DED0_TETSI|nr:hypothetical protein HHK36_016588 [Tetracentron sinense]
MPMMSGDGFSVPSSIIGFTQEPNLIPNPNPSFNANPVVKKKRNLPGTPGKQASSSYFTSSSDSLFLLLFLYLVFTVLTDPEAEVIALSPTTLMATNRFVCEICNKGFQRDQNLQLHRRGHNLPWKLKQRSSKEIRKRVYICPEKSCVHHDPSRALGDLTGIKKHFSRKHGEKKWKCEKCSKKYAVQSDWKAHNKTCGTREYKCDCGTLFSRKDSFITHRAFCDALAEESARFTSVAATSLNFQTNSINATTVNPQLSSLSHGYSGRGGEEASGITQFCSVFRPDFAGPESAAYPLNSDQQKPRLSLWLDQANSHLNPMELTANSNAYLASSSMGFPELVNMQSANIFGSSSSIVDYGSCSTQSQWLDRCAGPSTSANLSLSTMSPPGLIKEEGRNKGHMVESLASLYSNNQNQQPNLAHLSATALLQKAAQMGSKKSNSLFGGVRSSSSDTTSFNPNTQIRNEFNQLFRQAKQPENLSELTGTTPVGDGLLGGLDLSSLTNSGNNLNHLMMPPNSGKQSQSVPLKLHPNEVEHSLTRDFLGLGRGDTSRPFLQQELAKFASMGSAMGFSQYNGNL